MKYYKFYRFLTPIHKQIFGKMGKKFGENN